MARRRNSVTKRFARMKGLPPEEKALMQRIGNLMDAALNNRQASNPFEQSRVRTNRQVYPPTGLLTQQGFSSVKILWDATPSNELLRYEVDFINLTTGASETKTTFTNEITYKGTDGSYLAKVKSVGRDGSSSTVRQVSFALGDNVMLIEGAKNGPTELGTLVQDNILLRDGYSVYAWGSCVLDKYMLQTNSSVTFRLWRAEKADASIGEATLVETITLYPGTESGTNLDATARAGLITRPSGTRSGSFETSQSVMFSPQQVAAADDEKTVTYFLQAVNRETENDEVCLSLVLWSGADGIGTAVPGDPVQRKAPYIHPHFNSFHAQGAPNGTYQYNLPYDTRSWCANIESGYSLIGNHWTVAMWVRFDTLAAAKISGGNSEGVPDGGDQIFLSRSTIDISGDLNYTPNAWRFRLTAANLGGGAYQHQLHFQIWDKFAGDAGGNPVDGADDRTVQYNGNTYGPGDRFSALFPWGDSQSTRDDSKNNAWYFIVCCFEGGYYTGSVPKFRLYMNTATDALTGAPSMALMVPASDGSLSPIEQDDSGSLTYQFEQFEDSLASGKYSEGVFCGDLNQAFVSAGMQYHQIGIWNAALDSAATGTASNIGPIQTLFNQGRGWAVDWRRNSNTYALDGPYSHLNYLQAENLVHLCQMGAVEEWFQTKQAGRDTGYFLPDWEGELSWTYDRSDQDYEWREPDPGGARYHQRKIDDVWYDNLPQSWNRGTDIYDVLSPLGTNNTTGYDFAYPGQNMSGDGTISQADDGAADRDPPQRVSAPYSPGYNPTDPNRPITGGA